MKEKIKKCIKGALYIALEYGHGEAAQILANKGAQCTEAEKLKLGNKYTQFSGKRAQAALQGQGQGAGQPIQGKVQGIERPSQEQDSLSKEENATGTKEQEEGKEEKEIREKGGFVFQSSSKEGREGGERGARKEKRKEILIHLYITTLLPQNKRSDMVLDGEQ